MPSTWPLEALKVQAVAARTYALATRKTDGAFDQYPDTRSQVYRGRHRRERAQRRRGARHRRPHRHLRRPAGGDLLLLHLRRAHRERRVLVPRLAARSRGSWACRTPTTPSRPTTAGSVTFSASPARPGARSSGRVQAPEGAPARRLAARRARPRDRQRGSRTVTGPQVRAALGLRDTWFTHYRVASSASRARSARPASWGPRPPVRTLAGEFRPAPRGRVLVVERATRRGFRTVERLRTSRTGRYSVGLVRAGTYRVRHGRVTGPRVRVR